MREERADDAAWTHDPSRLSRGNIACIHVNAVERDLGNEIGAIVENQFRPSRRKCGTKNRGVGRARAAFAAPAPGTSHALGDPSEQ